MSDAEQTDDDIVENPEPEADFQAIEDLHPESEDESNLDHNIHTVGGGGGNDEDLFNLRMDDGERNRIDDNVEINNPLAEGDRIMDAGNEAEDNPGERNEAVDKSLAEGDQSIDLESSHSSTHKNVIQDNCLAEGDQHNEVSVQENHDGSLAVNGEAAESVVQDVLNNHDELAAEDEQCLRENEISFAGAEWSLEPEGNSQSYSALSDGSCAVGALSTEAVESEQTGNYIRTGSAERTESSSQLDDQDDSAESEAGPSSVSVVKSDASGCGVDQICAEGAAYSSRGEGHASNNSYQEPLLTAEEETTEADQEIISDFGNAEGVIRSAQSTYGMDTISNENGIQSAQSSLNNDNLDAAGPSTAIQVCEDEIGSLAPTESSSMIASESYQPECDQTALNESEGHSSNSSPHEIASAEVRSFKNSGKELNMDTSVEDEDEITISSSISKHSEISNKMSPSPPGDDQQAECDNKSNTSDSYGSNVNRNRYCDNQPGSTRPNNAPYDQKLSLSSEKGAIPKQRKSIQSHVESSPVKLNQSKGKKPPSTNTEPDASTHFTNSSEKSQGSLQSLNNGVEDAEEALLSELDATLQTDSTLNSRLTESHVINRNGSEVHMSPSIAQSELTDEVDASCEQCRQNNLACSLMLSKGDHSNIPEMAELKRQLHQAKNLLLESECQIGRLKDDLEEKEERYNTLVLENESYCKEVECLKAQSSDDLYMPQIKELEYTIAQQQNEIRSWKDKLASHDASAKRAIATLQNEMKIRLDQVTKTCQEATKEKDSMVVKYAQAEHKNLEFKKQAERAESKLREMEKERDAFLLKMKSIKEQRTRLGAELETKNTELYNVNKELDKHRELVSSSDVRVKWAQNKLKAELEAHKETKTQLERTSAKLKEAKEETQQIRADCQAIIKTYQESEEVKSNSLDKELKQKETELLVNQQEKTNWELAHVKTQRELERVKGELRDSKSHCANLTEKVTSLEGRLGQSTDTVEKYGEIIQKQKKEIQDFRERVETLVQYRTDFTRSQELIKTLDTEISELKISNKDLMAEMEACKKREMDKLELTEKLTNKNVELRSENTGLGNKVFSLTGELQSIKMEYQDTDAKIKELTESLEKEQSLRREETQTLTTKLAGKCKAVEDLTRKWDEEKDEIKTLKRKHTNNIRDLTRQLQLVRRKLETYEASSVNGDKDTVSMGSRTSSNGSLNINEQPNTQVAQPNNTAGQTANQLQNHTITEQEYPVITEQVEVDKQMLIERIVKLQRALARKNEKLEFMEDHISQLVDEIQKKNKIIQSYILKEDSGTMTSEFSDKAKAEISRKHSIMGSVYSSHSNDGTMSMDLSLEINRKLQAVLEDTLLKNMTLKDSIDTLGQEIARLSQENRQLQLKFQGLTKSRGKGNPAGR